MTSFVPIILLIHVLGIIFLASRNTSNYLWRHRRSQDAAPFRVVWNSPSLECKHKYGIDIEASLRRHQISVNGNQSFAGDEVTLFYHLGSFPYYKNGTAVNGGIPQLGDLTSHLRKLDNDVNSVIPQRYYDGLAVIDFESWRPLWDLNFDALAVYQRHSIDLVKKQHPDWNETLAKAEAKLQFESAARAYFTSTLEFAKLHRPQGKWGFYGFPDCHNHKGEKFCNRNIIKLDNELHWLFDKSSMLNPSVYLGLDLNSTERGYVVYAVMQESIRVSQKTKKHDQRSVYPYMMYYYRKNIDTNLKEVDLANTIGQAALLGLDGIAIWGSSGAVNTLHRCEVLAYYVEEILGPFADYVTNSARTCSLKICNGHGRCRLRTNAPQMLGKPMPETLRFVYKHQKRILNGLKHPSRGWLGQDKQDVVCKCYERWTGHDCRIPKHTFSFQ